MHQTSPSKRLPEEESVQLLAGKGRKNFFLKSCHFAMLYFPPADIPSTVSIPTLCLWCSTPPNSSPTQRRRSALLNE